MSQLTPRETKKAAKLERVNHANQILVGIASVGRNFFSHKGKISWFEVDAHGKIWFIDSYKENRTYTHYKGRWCKFSQGGTMRNIVEILRDYISHGEPVTPRIVVPAQYTYGDVWGYGDEALKELQVICNDNPMFELKPLDFVAQIEAKLAAKEAG